MALNAVCNERLECREKLLVNLIRTIELIVDVCVSRQSVYCFRSGFNHLHSCVKSILRHGAKIKHHLIFYQSSFAAFDTWLESKLADHSLVTELSGSHEDIKEFYYEWACLHDQRLFQLFVNSLHVLSTRDLDLLADIMSSDIDFRPVTPVRTLLPISCQNDNRSEGGLPKGSSNCTTDFNFSSSSSVPIASRLPVEPNELEAQIYATDTDDASSNLSIPTFSYTLVSPLSSPPEFSQMTSGMGFDSNRNSSGSSLSSSVFQDNVTQPVPGNIAPSSISSNESRNSLQEKKVRRRSSSKSPFSDETLPLESKKTPVSFLESGGLIHPPALGNFPLPQKGQSLTSFLSSLSDTLPELDRENAHFNVSEALMSAFERLKVSKSIYETINPDHVDGSNDTEDMFGTVKPVEKIAEEQMTKSDRLTVPKHSSKHFYSGKTFPRAPVLHTETEESEIEYWKQQPRRPPAHLKKKPRASKLGSDGRSDGLFSTTEASTSISSASAQSSDEDMTSSTFSAENVAMKLLRNAKMKDEHLPPACELQWLVSEKEAPQNLLPMPKNWITSASESESDYSSKADTAEKFDQSIRLRGTCDWAPPRPQIIFTIHPSPRLSILTETQKYRCAGCGMRVDPKYASTFRYCFYLGRYFCTGCHTGKKSRLPQMILHKWDFSPYMVSNFSATLLESLQSDPVYNALAINPNLSRKVKLNNFRNYRIQLGFLNEYLKICKAAEPLYETFKKFRTYYTSDVDLYSLEDLINVRFSTGMPLFVKDFVSHAVHHVLHCELCRNLGFVCEICKRNEILFAFQINRVSRCPSCASCFHLKCFNPNMSDCPKCLRVTKRRNTVEIPTASIAV